MCSENEGGDCFFYPRGAIPTTTPVTYILVQYKYWFSLMYVVSVYIPGGKLCLFSTYFQIILALICIISCNVYFGIEAWRQDTMV